MHALFHTDSYITEYHYGQTVNQFFKGRSILILISIMFLNVLPSEALQRNPTGRVADTVIRLKPWTTLVEDPYCFCIQVKRQDCGPWLWLIAGFVSRGDGRYVDVLQHWLPASCWLMHISQYTLLPLTRSGSLNIILEASGSGCSATPCSPWYFYWIRDWGPWAVPHW